MTQVKQKLAVGTFQEFTSLIQRSGLLQLDKEYFLALFVRDGGLTEDTEKELMAALQESDDIIQLEQFMENEEVKAKTEETFRETGFNDIAKELIEAEIDLAKKLGERDDAIKKHEKTADEKFAEIEEKFKDDEDDARIAPEFDAWMQEYRDKHGREFLKLTQAVDGARKRRDTAEKALEELSKNIEKTE